MDSIIFLLLKINNNSINLWIKLSSRKFYELKNKKRIYHEFDYFERWQIFFPPLFGDKISRVELEWRDCEYTSVDLSRRSQKKSYCLAC